MADLELAAMEQIAFKRYKVIGMFVGEQHWTVMARDPNHAAKLISTWSRKCRKRKGRYRWCLEAQTPNI
jgi:hypothetical protein